MTSYTQAEFNPSPAYWEEYTKSLPTLGEAWLRSCKLARKKIFIIDTVSGEVSAERALVGSILLSQKIAAHSQGARVGLLLPSCTASILCNMATMLLGRTAVNLNFTASTEAMASAIKQAELDTIFTSRRFLDRLKQRGVDLSGLIERCQLVLLEDIMQNIGALKKLFTLLECRLSSTEHLLNKYCAKVSTTEVAQVLFSSGSEGIPKGVMLSHRNLMANIAQANQLILMQPGDVILANLPPFHSFGLMATYFLPLLEGHTVLCHPDPTDVVAAANAIEKYKVTLMFSTSSFFRLYVRNPKISGDQLRSIRFLIAGAEKLQREVVKEFQDKFGLYILEGYGATETAPVACVNLPETNRPSWREGQAVERAGSVGLPIGGTELRIVDPDTMEELTEGEAGMILISGPQVMVGYLGQTELTARSLRQIDGRTWYVSGDKGYLDSDGFLYIQDRYSRFAKIGGEMISLSVVEQALRNAVSEPDLDVLVVTAPDARKGEQLLVLSTQALDPKIMRERLKIAGLNSLALPTAYFVVDSIPRLGSGKTDYAGGKALALELTASM